MSLGTKKTDANDGLASAIFLDPVKKTVIFVQQLDHRDLKYTLPGGKIMTGENPDDAVAREIGAECGKIPKEILQNAIKNEEADVVPVQRRGPYGRFVNYVYLVVCNTPPLREEGVSEPGEMLGPPEELSFEEIISGQANTDGGPFPIAGSHRWIISVVLSVIKDDPVLYGEYWRTLSDLLEKLEPKLQEEKKERIRQRQF